MKQKTTIIELAVLAAIILAGWLLIPHIARAHCDTMDGPVVMTAQAALEKGDVTPVLKWVSKEHEDEVRAAFKKTLAVRKKGKEAKELADMYFFETLVRLHRAGEGAPYTGLKPAGDVEPIIAHADKALESGSVDEVINLLTKAMTDEVHKQFDRVVETKKNADKTVEAGREYVEAYIEFTHYVERLHNDIVGKAGHHEEPAEKE